MRRRRRRYGSFAGWDPYVPVAQRRARAKAEVAKLKKQGKEIHPVEIEGRTIARSFWGKGWCSHLESFGDFSNRLPRGRSYVRNGSVCHLDIQEGTVEAMVAGSKLYHVEVDITPLNKKTWGDLKQQCIGKIGSLIELLQGNLSDEIMRTVTDREHGLFPRPGQIRYSCDCPDVARMCKHISAVMYGIGARLDEKPELLFLLRGVDHEELITADAAADAIAGTDSRRTRRRSLSAADVEDVFGVELEETAADTSSAPSKPRSRSQSTRPKKVSGKKTAPASRGKKTDASKRKKAERGKSSRDSEKKKPFQPTARSVVRLRRKLEMSQAAFADAVGVSTATISNWEKATGPIKPHAKGLAGLQRLHKQSS